jgi:hypothetical protein
MDTQPLADAMLQIVKMILENNSQNQQNHNVVMPNP